MKPSIMPIVVQVVKQTAIIPHMTSPQEKQFKEERQKIS